MSTFYRYYKKSTINVTNSCQLDIKTVGQKKQPAPNLTFIPWILRFPNMGISALSIGLSLIRRMWPGNLVQKRQQQIAAVENVPRIHVIVENLLGICRIDRFRATLYIPREECSSDSDEQSCFRERLKIYRTVRECCRFNKRPIWASRRY